MGTNSESKDRKWDELADAKSLERMCLLLEPKQEDVVCDAGTGKGSAALAIAPKVKRVVAIDAVANRQAIFQAAGKENVEFLCEDLDNGKLPFENGTTDIVICRAALHHFENKQNFFRDAFRVLRKGGRLYVMDPVMSPELRLAWSIISRIAEKDYRAYCTVHKLVDGIIDAGFDIGYKGEFLFPRSLHDWINSKICEKDTSGNEIESDFVKHVRQTIWQIVYNLFPGEFRRELHMSSDTEDGWFAYNCLEIVAYKV